MNRGMTVLAGILLMVVALQGQDRTATTASAQADTLLITNERALYQAVAKADRATFASLVLPAGVWTTRQGFVPMELLVNGLDAFALTKWDIVNPRVTWLGTDSAIVVYSWTGSGTYGERPLAPITLASTVWTRRDGKWLAVHHQETDLVQN